MTTISAEMHQVITALGWALLHSIWQAAIVYSIVFVLHRAVKDIPATLKYNTGILAMGIVFVWFCKTFISYIDTAQATVYVSTGSSIIHHNTTTVLSNSISTGNNWHYYIEQYLPALVNLYIAGLGILLGRLLYNFYRTQRIRSKGLIVPDIQYVSSFYNYARQMNIGKGVRFFLSTYIDTPMVAGALKPIVLVPAAMISQLQPDELEAILLHELAHIKRHDYLFNILQTVIETILFFNPFVWLISKQVRREREHCCDDMVLAYTEDALPYAKALASLEMYRQNNNQLTLAAAGNKHQLFNRIKRIMEMKKNTTSYPQVMLTICIMLGLAISLVWLSPAIAQTRKNKPTNEGDNKKAEKTHSTNKTITIIHKDGVTNTYTSTDEISGDDAKKLKDIDISFDDEGVMHQGNIKVFSDSIKIMLDDNNEHGTTKVIRLNSGDKHKDAEMEKMISEAMKEADIAKTIDEAFNNMDVRITTDGKGKHQRKVIVLNTNGGAGWDELSEEDKRAVEKAKKEAMEELGMADEKMKDAKKVMIVADKQMKDANKVIVIADKRIAEANIRLADADKQLAEADKRLAEADKQLKKNKIVIVQKGEKPSGSTKVTVPENYDEVLNNMEAEGLISTNNGFVIEKKDNNLYINNKLQSTDVYNRYKRSIDGDHVKISGTKDNLNVHVYNR